MRTLLFAGQAGARLRCSDESAPGASWTDTYPKFDVGRLTFPSL